MKSLELWGGVCLLSLVCAVGAQAQSVNCDSPTGVVPDGRLTAATLPGNTVFWFVLSTNQGRASYVVEADFPHAAATTPLLQVFAPSDVGPGPGCVTSPSSVSARVIEGVTPEAPNGKRLSVLKTGAGSARFLLRVENAGVASQALTLRVTETTLFSPRWSTFGGFYTSWGIHNTANATVNVTLTVANTGGVTVATAGPFAVAAGQIVFRDTRTTDLNLSPNQSGKVLLIHDGPPGAIQADGFMVNETGTPFVVIPAKFEELRAASSAASGLEGGGGGDITAVNTPAGSGLEGGATSGDVSLGLLTSCGAGQVLKWSGTAWGCAPDVIGGGGTVVSVGSGTGLTGGPITLSGTLSIDTAVVPRLNAANTFTGGPQTIQTGAPANTGVIVQGAASQNANLQEWRDSSAAVVASVSPSGVITGDGSGLTSLSTSQFVGGGINPQQVALLRWYPANESAITFPVGVGPVGAVFDGANVWVANANSGDVTKLRVSDGVVLGTFALGGSPQGGAFDGANIWVVNAGSNTVTKLRASDGAVLGTFPVGSVPRGAAFDGANIWVVNGGSNTVTKLRASDGAVLGTFAVGSVPRGVVFDGANIWVVNGGSNMVTKLRASDGAVLGTFPVGNIPFGVAFDGANIWVANTGSNTVTKLRASDGLVLGTFAVGASPVGVAFDGANIWVTNAGSNTVTKLRANDGVVLGTFAVGLSPRGVAFDGANIWVTNASSSTVSKL